VDNNAAGLSRRGGDRAVGVVAAARQPVLAGGQRAQRVGAPLPDRARIVRADRLGDFVEPTIQGLATTLPLTSAMPGSIGETSR
jgi:hypothetical protein